MDQLMKDPKNGLVFGVCAGFAEWINAPVGMVRLATVVSFFLTGSLTFWAYVLLAIFLPSKA